MDESSQTNHRYLVMGGMITEIGEASPTCGAIYKARLPSLPAGNMKWAKVSRGKLAAYRNVVDAVYEIQKQTTLDFHSLVVDTTKVDNNKFNQSSSEIGFNKEVYQLALKFGRLYNCLFHIYPDRRTTNQKPEDMRVMLNRGLRKKGDDRDWPFRRVQFREPEDSQILQVVDVLIGAIAFSLNGHDKKPNASPAKIELSRYIFRKWGVSPSIDTSMRGRFTIWHRRLR